MIAILYWIKRVSLATTLGLCHVYLRSVGCIKIENIKIEMYKKTFSKGQVYLPSLNSFHANLTTAYDVINGFKNKCPF